MPRPRRIPDPKQFHPYDLFGEIPVTDTDIFEWVSAVAPRWLRPERSYRLYIESWDVAGKVKAAKASGDFDTIIANPARVAPWHARLPLDVL
jgi:hypothetical protein